MSKTASYLTKSGLILTTLFTFLLYTGFAQSSKKPTITESFTLNGPGTLKVTTSGGGIAVEGKDGNKVEVQVFVKKNGNYLSSSSSEFAEIQEGYEMKIEKSGNTIHAYSKRKDRNQKWNKVSISYHVTVPHRMATELNTSGGGISVSDVQGDQSIHTSGGGITLKEISGQVSAHTSGGGISVVGQRGLMELRTSGGGISVVDASGNINGATSGGGISLANIDGEVDVRTSGGGINVTGSANYVKAITSGGNIRVDVSDIRKGLYLETSGGGIKARIPNNQGLDLDLRAQKVNMDLHNFSGSSGKGKIVGAMNGGGIPVHMHTSGGNIEILN